MAATIALVLLLIAAVGLLAFQRYRSEAALAQISADIDQALTYGDLETAAALLKSVPPNDDRFDDFRSQLSEKQAVEQRRVNQFQATVDAIRSDLLAATEEDEFDLLSNRTGKLKQQAVKADELAVAETLADDVESHREQRREEFIQATRELCDQIRADLRTLTLDRNARRSLTQWNLSLQQHRTSRWIRQQSDLQKEIAETSDAVADRWDAIRAGSVK